MSRHSASRATSQYGFTMIELALALAIVGLLIVVAVASIYDHQSQKSKRQAIHRLNEVAEWLHVQRANQPSFAAILPGDWSTYDAGRKYRITLATTSITASDPKTVFPASGQGAFTLQAVPDVKDECGTLLLDHTGRRGVTGQDATVADCWNSQVAHPK